MTSDVTSRIVLWQNRSLLAGIAGVLLSVVGLLLNHDQFLRSYLFAYAYWTGLAIGCLGILALHHTVGGKWGLVIRRLCEAGSRTLPAMGLLIVPILLAMPALYVWDRPGAAQSANVHTKTLYLNAPFFIARTALYFAVWSFYAWKLSAWSKQQDHAEDPGLNQKLIAKMRALSAPGLVVITFTATFAFVDWIMSLEPEWFSTIYGAMFLMGEVLEAFAFVIALVIVLARLEPLRDYVTPQHLHDLGNMMFTFTILWAYTAFSQYLIIWAGNLPDEIPWYVRRLGQGWGGVALVIVLFHFCLPFLLLLQRDIKRNADRLFALALFMLVIRMIDVYWIVEPSFYGDRIQIHWTDFVAPLAVGGLWLALFFRQLRAMPLAPMNDPRLKEAPRETVAY